MSEWEDFLLNKIVIVQTNNFASWKYLQKLVFTIQSTIMCGGGLFDIWISARPDTSGCLIKRLAAISKTDSK